MIITIGTEKNTYLNPCHDDEQRNEVDTSTIEGRYTKKVIDEANRLYNSLRAKIRQKLRTEYEESQEPFIK